MEFKGRTMPEFCICTKSQRPRLFFTFCFLFSLITVLISSIFFYYPDGFKTTPSPSVSFISDGGPNVGYGASERYVRYGFDNGNAGGNGRQQYVMGPRPVRGRFPGRVEEVGRHYTNGHGQPSQSGNGNHREEDDPLLMDYIEGHHDPVMQNSRGSSNNNNNENSNNLESSSEENAQLQRESNNLERIRHQSHHPFERHHLSLSELEQKSNFSQIIDSRLIHLDLKGAPPKMSYIKDVLRLAKKAGINGLLLEWEDTFPWQGQLKNMSLVKGGYSQEEAEEIVAFAERTLGFEVIPLVQTFGHVEYVLKMEQWKHLREVDGDPQSFCPSKSGTLVLIQQMIDQTLELHKNSKFIHIGCDEVYNLRTCSLCTAASDFRDELFLKHVIDVSSYVRSKGRIPIIWDDMLRSIPIRKLNDSGIGQLVEPMVWVYAEDVDRFVGWESWEKYAEVFPTIWAAAAFKGAFGETLSIPPASRHADNVQRWVDVITRESSRWSQGVGGLVLTGWMRYDHFSVLCELLPASMPSMVYTSLVLSTPSSSSNSIKNRVFIPKSSLESSSTTTTMSSTSPSSASPVTGMDAPGVNELVPSSDGNGEGGVGNNALDSLSASAVTTTTTDESVPAPRIFRRSASRPFRSIPHPRILMQNRDGFSNQRLHAREIVTQPEIYDKGEIISKLFEDVLNCPNHHTRIDKMLRDSDGDLGFATRCNFPGVAFFRTVFRVRSLLDDIWELDAKISRKRGWVTPYNIRHNYSLPLRVDEVVFAQVPRLQRHLVILANSVVTSLKPIFSTETILEWIEQNMWEAWKAMDKLEKAGDILRNTQVWPRRPVLTPPKMASDLRLTALEDSENAVEPEEL